MIEGVLLNSRASGSPHMEPSFLGVAPVSCSTVRRMVRNSAGGILGGVGAKS